MAAPVLADPVRMQVRNDSPAPVATLQVSPDYSTSWGSNRLSGLLGPGESAVIHLSEEACFFDIQVEDARGRVQQIWGVNLCARPQLDLR